LVVERVAPATAPAAGRVPIGPAAGNPLTMMRWRLGGIWREEASLYGESRTTEKGVKRRPAPPDRRFRPDVANVSKYLD